MLTKRRCWKDEHKIKCGCSKHFSRVWVLDLGYESLKTLIENPHFIFCSSFQNLRLGSMQLRSPCSPQWLSSFCTTMTSCSPIEDFGRRNTKEEMWILKHFSTAWVLNVGHGMVRMVCVTGIIIVAIISSWCGDIDSRVMMLCHVGRLLYVRPSTVRCWWMI